MNKQSVGDSAVIALAGNPNVGKSTVFNALTGLHQHTGNWTGKTVGSARGTFVYGGVRYELTDTPGTYSLLAHSAEEEVTRDYICFGDAEAVIIVCDATCLERNLGLALQITEVMPRGVLCVNLMDEAEKKGIRVDTERLSELIGIPVCGMSARDGKGLEEMQRLLSRAVEGDRVCGREIELPQELEAVRGKIAAMDFTPKNNLPKRWAALKLLEGDEDFSSRLVADAEVAKAVHRERERLCGMGIDGNRLTDMIASAYVRRAEEIAGECVSFVKPDYWERDRRIDRILTHRVWGLPIMLAMLAVILWITVVGANYPSEWLSAVLFSFGGKLSDGLASAGAPEWLRSMLIDGIYRVLAWVVSVMLPPMAIFFPMFTLLEDAGFLPRIAFNADGLFRRSGACGKQALTMAMGFGCNAVGVTGCRIIDSPRERLIAILTNVFVPCNGRFPTLIAVITVFLAAGSGIWRELSAVVILLAVILFGMGITLAISKLLSCTILKGVPSSFVLELPPYRRPQVGKVIVRSVLDRTLFVLGRAVTSAVPAGLIIWLMGAVKIGDVSALTFCADALDPLGTIMGLDGAILLGFILGFPANEIVIPVILMAYTAAGAPMEYESIDALGRILAENGWTVSTAVCMLIFMVCHFPCATTVLTIRKETGSLKQTAGAVLLPTAVGFVLCTAVSFLMNL